MRIPITGGAGFLGSALADALITKNHEVLVLDDLSAGDGGGVSRLRADLSLARSVLGYQPEVALRVGLGRVLEEDPRYQ